MALPALFYPAHDLALANGVRHFTPPTAALQLQKDLEALSSWWQPDPPSALPLPWGWNYEIRQSFLHAGAEETQLPSLQELAELRTISSRQTTIRLLQQIKQEAVPDLSATFDAIRFPEFLTSEKELVAAIAGNTRPFLLKSPWSSSGRGLCWSRITPPELLLKRGKAILREMGGVILEQEYPKVQDFAMLFYIGRQEVQFVGYSLFDTDPKGTYQNGRIMSNEQIVRYLGQWVSANTLKSLGDLYRTRILPALFAPFLRRPYSLGYVGVDLMIFRDPNQQPCIHPCIELNARCTMGVVARRIFDRKVHPESSGRFIISHAKDSAALAEEQNTLKRNFPAVETEKQFISGYIPLTPILKGSHFAAYLLLNASQTK